MRKDGIAGTVVAKEGGQAEAAVWRLAILEYKTPREADQQIEMMDIWLSFRELSWYQNTDSAMTGQDGTAQRRWRSRQPHFNGSAPSSIVTSLLVVSTPGMTSSISTSLIAGTTPWALWNPRGTDRRSLAKVNS
jgi:hypothetical protein